MSSGPTFPDPPPEIVAAARRDYADITGQLDAMIAGTCDVQARHSTELGLFMHIYATTRLAEHTRAAALAALAVLRLIEIPHADGRSPP